MEREAAALRPLHREDGHPQPRPLPRGRGPRLQPRPRLQRQERGGLLQDGRHRLRHEVWQIRQGGEHFGAR